MTASDLRFALRRLRRHAAASIAATLTLALGVGAVTALFSVVRAVLLRPPPFRAPHELVAVDLHPAARPETRLEISYPDFRDWRARSRSFQDLAAHQTALGRVVWEGGGEPVPAAGFMVSGHFFDLLGVRPAIGRALEPADDRPGAAPVLVLSDALWRRELGGTMMRSAAPCGSTGSPTPSSASCRRRSTTRGAQASGARSSRRWTRWWTNERSGSSR